MNSALVKARPATTRTTARTRSRRRSILISSLPAAEGRDGRGGRGLPRAGGWRRCSRRTPLSRSTASRLAAAPGRQRQIGEHTGSAFGGFVDDHLMAVPQHLFHGFEVEPFEGDVPRCSKGAIDRVEAIGIALGTGGNFLAISFSLLFDSRGVAARPRDDVVAVRLGFVAQPLAVGERALDVAEGVDDRAWRIDPQQLQLSDLDPRVVGVEDPLQQGMRVGFDFTAPLRQRLGDRRLADHFAHGTLGRGFHRRVRSPDTEEIGLGVLDYPKDGEVDIDDVLVTGQHQGFFRHLARHRAADRRTFGAAVADLGAVDAGHAGSQHFLNRARQVVIEAGLGGPIIGPKAQHDADLVRVYGIDAARHPAADNDQHDDGDPTPVAEAAGRQYPPEAILAATQQLFEIRRLRPAPARTRPAAIAAVAAAPRPAAARTGAPRRTALTLPEHRPRTFPQATPAPRSQWLRSARASTRNRAAGRRPIEGARASVVKWRRPPQIPRIQRRRCSGRRRVVVGDELSSRSGRRTKWPPSPRDRSWTR